MGIVEESFHRGALDSGGSLSHGFKEALLSGPDNAVGIGPVALNQCLSRRAVEKVFFEAEVCKQGFELVVDGTLCLDHAGICSFVDFVPFSEQ